MSIDRSERSPAFKLGLALAVGLLLSLPLFSVYLLSWDRESQSRAAAESITSGWGAPQALTGPVLVIPYRATAAETVVESGKSVTRSRDVMRVTLSSSRSTMSASPTWSPESSSRSSSV